MHRKAGLMLYGIGVLFLKMMPAAGGPQVAASRKEGQGGNSGERRASAGGRLSSTRSDQTEASRRETRGCRRLGAKPKRQRRGHATMIKQYRIYPLHILVQW